MAKRLGAEVREQAAQGAGPPGCSCLAEAGSRLLVDMSRLGAETWRVSSSHVVQRAGWSLETARGRGGESTRWTQAQSKTWATSYARDGEATSASVLLCSVLLSTRVVLISTSTTEPSHVWCAHLRRKRRKLRVKEDRVTTWQPQLSWIMAPYGSTLSRADGTPRDGCHLVSQQVAALEPPTRRGARGVLEMRNSRRCRDASWCPSADKAGDGERECDGLAWCVRPVTGWLPCSASSATEARQARHGLARLGDGG